MAKRKLIGLILGCPEGVYQQRVLDGVFSQCEKYGYDVAVFSPLVQNCLSDEKYRDGEMNIFELMNFDKLDGVIVAPISFISDNIYDLYDELIEKLKKECKKPVVSIDLPFGDAPSVNTDDYTAFVTISEHIINEHDCRNVFFLSGPEEHDVANERLRGFRETFEKHGIIIPEENIFFGDFWYPSGEQLAERIASGELPMPDAVICASDHMAIGCTNRLMERGINVPSQVIVTGYDATPEAAVNEPAITTYIPDICISSGEAVNMLRSAMEPDAEILSADRTTGSGLKICSSCGCPENLSYIKRRLNGILYNSVSNYTDDSEFYRVNIAKLLDSYMFESFTGSQDVLDCFNKIFASDYLIMPYDAFYLCLKEHWLNTDDCTINGYPSVMNNPICCVSQNSVKEGQPDPRHLSIYNDHLFDTSEMLPQLYDEREYPCAFYFVPVHFSNETLGYAVLRNRLDQPEKLGTVFHNWLRNVNNALEMIRVQHRLTMFSERDAMTGLLNRRGMELRLDELNSHATASSSWLVFVIDMDGLKYINDTFGHSEGDKGISIIASAARQIARSDEICVRAGGDEFYVIGVGEYNMIDAIVRIQKFNQALAEENKLNRPYELSASIGYCCEPVNSGIGFDGALKLADSRMYEDKIKRKKERK